MISDFAKFARTNKSLIVFSNAFDHIEIFKKFYNARVKPKEFGFIKLENSELVLFHEDLKCDLICGISDQKIRYKLLENLKQESKYIMTPTKFIIFPKKFTFKRVANRLFTDYIIQGAGKIVFELENEELKVKCLGGSKTLRVKAREIDSLIIKDELEASFA